MEKEQKKAEKMKKIYGLINKYSTMSTQNKIINENVNVNESRNRCNNPK